MALRAAARTNTYHLAFRLLPQAIRSRGLQHLQLAQVYGSQPADVLALLVTPSLSSFVTSMALWLRPDHVNACFPFPLPLKSLDIHCSYASGRIWTADGTSQAPSAALALPLLCERLPALTHLTLRVQSANLSDPKAAGPAAPVLAGLSHLQQLHVAGNSLAGGIASSLPLLPALTRLELPHLIPLQHVPVLASLRGLRSLHLGHERQFLGEDSAVAILGIVGQMGGLTELALANCQLFYAPEAFELLLPPPVLLRKLVVGHEVMRETALGVLGGDVDQICVRVCD
jgi:hypothetical protein